MQPRKLRIVSAITAGSLALAVAAITASSGTSHAATHAALAVQTESFPPVNLDACPTLHTGYPPGGCVAQLQTELNIIQGNHLTVDGIFGSADSQTYEAVIAFQQAHGLQHDGMVGPATKQALDAALSVPIPTVPAPTVATSGPGTSDGSGATNTAPTGTAVPASGLSTTDFTCKNWNNIATWHQIPIPTSSICGYIGQGGRDLESSFRQEGWFNTLEYKFSIWPAACNYWVDFDIWSATGEQYYHNQGSQVNGCASTVLTTTGVRALNADYILRPNSDVCVTVWERKESNITGVVRTCGVIS